MTCKFEISGPHRLPCRVVRKLLQAFTRRHVPCAMCHQSTHGRHHRRSGVLVRRMVPRRARSDQPFGRYSRKCLDTHTDRQTRPANYFSPTHQRKSSFIERSMLKHLNVHSLRFWITRPTGGGAISSPPLISETTGPNLKIQAAFESPGKIVGGKQILLTSGSRVTSQVRSKSKCWTFRAW